MWVVGFLSEHSNEPALGFLIMLTWVGFVFIISPSQTLLAHGERAAKTGVLEPDFWGPILSNPATVLVLSFLLMGVAGGVVLSLPAMSTQGSHGFLDALFTAVSATCVTGLIVLDTPVDFSFWGQLTIAILIQLGGLGIMVFSAAAFVLFGRKLSLAHERAAVDLIGASGRADLVHATRLVFLVTFLTEGVGALLLSISFVVGGDPLLVGIWRGIFTAISAFCNAGFALQSDSLMPYATDPFALIVVSVLIVVGGLGPGVVAAVVGWRNRRIRTLHSRLVIWTTVILLLAPMIGFLVLEWNQTLGDFSFADKVINAWFQSVTLRTAGFNSVDLAAVQPATLILLMLMMFVGGSPGSTAGGIKTTTAAVIALSVIAVMRGRDRIDAFGRTIPGDVVLRATAISLVGALSAAFALAAILLSQDMALDLALFEVISALATVGLSIGGTGQLDEIGKVIIIVCMFAGRVGPITLLIFMVSRTRASGRVALPLERPVVG
jgi:trk system potassium uptake protein TrkH